MICSHRGPHTNHPRTIVDPEDLNPNHSTQCNIRVLDTSTWSLCNCLDVAENPWPAHAPEHHPCRVGQRPAALAAYGWVPGGPCAWQSYCHGVSGSGGCPFLTSRSTGRRAARHLPACRPVGCMRAAHTLSARGQ
eukprot:353445-Chlamydomonas_euryale.AAC.17